MAGCSVGLCRPRATDGDIGPARVLENCRSTRTVAGVVGTNRLGCMTLRRAIVTLAVIAAALAVLRYVTNNRGG